MGAVDWPLIFGGISGEELELLVAAKTFTGNREIPGVSVKSMWYRGKGRVKMELTDEGKEILELARAPAEIDLQRYIGAWLGDVAAHDLFVGWEVELVNRALGSRTESDFENALEPEKKSIGGFVSDASGSRPLLNATAEIPGDRGRSGSSTNSRSSWERQTKARSGSYKVPPTARRSILKFPRWSEPLPTISSMPCCT